MLMLMLKCTTEEPTAIPLSLPLSMVQNLPTMRLQSTRPPSPPSSTTRLPPLHTALPLWQLPTTQLLPQWPTTLPTSPQYTTPPTVSPTMALPITSPSCNTMSLLLSTTVWLITLWPIQSSMPLQSMLWLMQLLTTRLQPHTMMLTSPLSVPLTTPRPGVWRIPSTPPTRLSMPCSTTTRASRRSTRTCWPTPRTAWTG